MIIPRLSACLAAAVALLVSALAFQAEAEAYMGCEVWVDTGDLPACLTFMDDSNADYGECAFQVRAVSECDDEIQLAFFCEESTRDCPHAAAIKPHGEELISLGVGHAYDILEPIQVASLPLDAAGTMYRYAHDYEFYDEMYCGTHMMGCSAAGQGPGSAALVLLALLGLVALRRR